MGLEFSLALQQTLSTMQSFWLVIPINIGSQRILGEDLGDKRAIFAFLETQKTIVKSGQVSTKHLKWG